MFESGTNPGIFWCLRSQLVKEDRNLNFRLPMLSSLHAQFSRHRHEPFHILDISWIKSAEINSMLDSIKLTSTKLTKKWEAMKSLPSFFLAEGLKKSLFQTMTWSLLNHRGVFPAKQNCLSEKKVKKKKKV